MMSILISGEQGGSYILIIKMIDVLTRIFGVSCFFDFYKKKSLGSKLIP